MLILQTQNKLISIVQKVCLVYPYNGDVMMVLMMDQLLMMKMTVMLTMLLLMTFTYDLSTRTPLEPV